MQSIEQQSKKCGRRYALSGKLRRRDYNVRHRGHDSNMSCQQHQRNKSFRRNDFHEDY